MISQLNYVNTFIDQAVNKIDWTSQGTSHHKILKTVATNEHMHI